MQFYRSSRHIPTKRKSRRALTIEELLAVVARAAGGSGPAALDRGGRAVGSPARVSADQLDGDDLVAHVFEAGHARVDGVALVCSGQVEHSDM